MLRLIALVFTFAVATSAQAMPIAPAHQPGQRQVHRHARASPSSPRRARLRHGYAIGQWQMRRHARRSTANALLARKTKALSRRTERDRAS
jgi:hypothetical protein